MPRALRSVLLVVGLVGVGLLGAGVPSVAAPAPGTPLEQPAPDPSAAADAGGNAPTPGEPVCTIKDERLFALSGIGAIESGYVMINDGTNSSIANRIFFLDSSCKVTKAVAYSGGGARDPEDVAVARDGTVWVADIGDNARNRPHVGLWKVPPGGNGQPTLYRLRYPDGAHDAEALLLDANDQPIIVTKDAGISGLYVPTGPLQPSTSAPNGVEMRKAGEFKPQRTGTSGYGGVLGQLLVTGGANSPDRTKVVLRTYTDAYEWDVPDGDVVKAVTTGKPRITPLPDERQGEGITYSADGTAFLTVSDLEDFPSDEQPKVLRYTPSVGVEPAPPAGGGAPRNTLAWYQRLSLDQVTMLVAGIGVVGILLVLIGIDGIRRSRRRARASAGRSGAGDEGAGSTAALPTEQLASPTPAHTRAAGGYYAAGDRSSGYPTAPPGYPDPGGGAGFGAGYAGGDQDWSGGAAGTEYRGGG
ncbi:MAG: hypothetical protein IRY92_03750, partial [Dactylosporangium sp.]|nr:hypothetical protein [Dactylosporangium sp.]